jgi:cobalt-zinc-cadmium efflux system protein
VLLAVQVVVGLSIGSLSLLADSLHNASDVVALVVALVGQVLAARPATDTRTYGYARTEVLAALLNGAVLLAVTGWVVVEAIGRFGDPPEVASTPLLVVGLVGMAVNGGSALLVARSGSSLNLRAAFWHLAGDALGSLGVVVAALAIAAFDAYWADPAASLVISVLVVAAVVGVLRDAIGVLLESVPRGIDTAEVTTALAALDGVTGVHHLHVWALDSETSALTAHLQMEHGTDLHRAQDRSNEAAALLRARFGIGHATLQVECDDGHGDVPVELGPRRGHDHH